MEFSIIDIMLDLAQFPENINRRLLIAIWRVFEVCQIAFGIVRHRSGRSETR